MVLKEACRWLSAPILLHAKQQFYWEQSWVNSFFFRILQWTMLDYYSSCPVTGRTTSSFALYAKSTDTHQEYLQETGRIYWLCELKLEKTKRRGRGKNRHDLCKSRKQIPADSNGKCFFLSWSRAGAMRKSTQCLLYRGSSGKEDIPPHKTWLQPLKQMSSLPPPNI